MPRYFFRVDGTRTDADPAGMEFESLAEAKCEAVKTAGALIFDVAGEFWEHAQWNMTVTDERGLTVFTLHFMGVESSAKHAPTPDRR